MDTKLSVIIPVYNVKNQVVRCLKSLHNQAMQAIEFLIVDDGSTDGTTEVVTDYLNKINDKRFKYFHKTNGGYSSAYNYALKRAEGIFVTVVESDDYLVNNSQAFSYLCSQALRDNLDVLEYSYQTVKFDKHDNINDTQVAFVNRHDSQVISGIALYYQSIENNDFHSYLWRYMFRRRFLLDNNLHCNENIFGVPDLLLTTSVLLKAQRAKFVNYVLYNYMVRANSITNDPKY